MTKRWSKIDFANALFRFWILIAKPLTELTRNPTAFLNLCVCMLSRGAHSHKLPLIYALLKLEKWLRTSHKKKGLKRLVYVYVYVYVFVCCVVLCVVLCVVSPSTCQLFACSFKLAIIPMGCHYLSLSLSLNQEKDMLQPLLTFGFLRERAYVGADYLEEGVKEKRKRKLTRKRRGKNKTSIP